MKGFLCSVEQHWVRQFLRSAKANAASDEKITLIITYKLF